MPATSLRLDAALVSLGYYPTREQAQRALLAGEVELNGRRDMKPGWTTSLRDTPGGPRLFKGATALTVSIRARPPYVSRGGLKLAAALDAFGLSPAGLCALDIGASTGGFTDCLLQRGAAKVYAVDCGTGQLHQRLRNDPRVVVMEKTNARLLQPDWFDDPIAFVVIDVSFISLRLIVPVVSRIARPGATVVALVKPQFEVGPERVARGGVVRDPQARRDAVALIRSAMRAAGWHVCDEIESPITGPAGNHEFLLGAQTAHA
jgi:23S rRNA (cytidine1920-2'-O)/16S rRNA (cytidine1409-2'-O)-methyltransferase